MRRIFWDGLFKYIYDPWNRLAQIKRAYRDTNNDLIVTSTVGTIQYDGQNRRIAKTITNSGDWNCEYHYYFDGWSRIEERDSSGQILKQYVWGSQYIDEIVQTCLNDDPADENEDVCETKYWGLQDANFNVLTVVGSDGSFAERYEYTPYGQRTVYKESHSGDDPMLAAPILESQRWKVSSTDQPYGLCDIGHQGLILDKEWGWYDNRTRPYGPVIARFPVQDEAYRDGMSLYQYLKNSPLGNKDPLGQVTIEKFSGKLMSKFHDSPLGEYELEIRRGSCDEGGTVDYQNVRLTKNADDMDWVEGGLDMLELASYITGKAGVGIAGVEIATREFEIGHRILERGETEEGCPEGCLMKSETVTIWQEVHFRMATLNFLGWKIWSPINERTIAGEDEQTFYGMCCPKN